MTDIDTKNCLFCQFRQTMEDKFGEKIATRAAITNRDVLIETLTEQNASLEAQAKRDINEIRRLQEIISLRKTKESENDRAYQTL